MPHKDPEKARLRHLRYRKPESYKKSKRKAYLKFKFSITIEQHKQLMVKQKGLCAICGEPENIQEKGKKRRLSIDHDHKTGQVRGLLCSQCNNGLGRFKDRPDLLISAANYLMKNEVKHGNADIAG